MQTDHGTQVSSVPSGARKMTSTAVETPPRGFVVLPHPSLNTTAPTKAVDARVLLIRTMVDLIRAGRAIGRRKGIQT